MPSRPRQKKPPLDPASAAPAIRCAYTRIVSVADLRPRPDNPNRHPEAQLQSYARILTHQGIRKPVVVSRQSGYIVTGHGLYETALREKWDTLPVDEQDFATPADETAHVIADNQLPQLAEIDELTLRDLVSSLSDFDLDLTAFDASELGDLLAEPPPPAPGIVKKIDVRPMPRIAWALIGVPVDEFGPVQDFLDTLSDDTIITTTISDQAK